jgi:hypothetical protein
MKVISRNKWDALPPKATPRKMVSTTDGFFLHHTVGGAPSTVAEERQEMRNLQQTAFARGFNDISYSFVVFPSGRIYEGRGKNIEGAHTYGYNDTAYGVAAAGNYDRSKPTKAMIESLKWLRRTYLRVGSKPIRPHSSVYATACPGQFLRARLDDI